MVERFRRRRREVEDELAMVFPQSQDPDGRLLATARQLHELLTTVRIEEAEPNYRAHLRASLLAEHRARSSVRAPRRHRVGSLFGVGLGLAGLAMLGVVLVSVLVLPPGPRQVVVQASVQNNPRVAVNQAIDLSFNQPMVESSVDQGLRIQPALTVSTAWNSATRLSIRPLHQLVPNVAYEVTISRKAARAQDGATPLSNIVIPFGTAPLSATPVGYPPSLVAVSQVATVDQPTALQYAPDGQLLVLAQGALAQGAASPAAVPGAAGVYSLSSPAALLAPGAAGPQPSPDSQSLAYWSSAGSSAELEVVPLGGGGQPQVVASSPDPDPVASWVNDSTLLYSGGQGLLEANLDGQVTAMFPFVKLGPSGFFEVAPGLTALYAEPQGIPTLYNLGTGSSLRLTGIQGIPVFSSNGSQVAYVALSGGRDSVVVASSTGAAPRAVVVAPAGVALSQLAFSPGGQYIAYVATTPGVGSQLGALALATGTSHLITSLSGVSLPVWSPEGTAISLVQNTGGGSEVLTIQLSVPPGAGAAGAGAAAAALDTASTLAQLQVSGGPGALTAIQGLLAPGTTIPTTSLLPGHFDRFYAVSSTASSSGSSVYQVQLELLRDPTGGLPAQYLDETASVSVTGTTGELTALTLGQPTALPPGPMVISATASSTAPGSVTFVLQFDADLDPATVGTQSVQLTQAGTQVPGVQVAYQASSRQVVVTATGLGSGTLVLTVGAPLSDVDHTLISPPYELSLPALPASTPTAG